MVHGPATLIPEDPARVRVVDHHDCPEFIGEVAQLWQSAPDPLTGWRRLRRFTPRIDRLTLSVDGSAYAEASDRELAFFLHDLLVQWKRPDSTIVRAHRGPGGVWKDPTSSVGPGSKFIGPV